MINDNFQSCSCNHVWLWTWDTQVRPACIITLNLTGMNLIQSYIASSRNLIAIPPSYHLVPTVWRWFFWFRSSSLESKGDHPSQWHEIIPLRYIYHEETKKNPNELVDPQFITILKYQTPTKKNQCPLLFQPNSIKSIKIWSFSNYIWTTKHKYHSRITNKLVYGETQRMNY